MTTKFGTAHLKNQDCGLGNIINSADKLVPGNWYCIADMGLGEWNGGYEYVGRDFCNDYYIFNFMIVCPGQKPDIWIFTNTEIAQMLSDGEIAECE